MAEELRRAISEVAPTLAGAAFPAGTLSISVGVACWEPARDAHVTSMPPAKRSSAQPIARSTRRRTADATASTWTRRGRGR